MEKKVIISFHTTTIYHVHMADKNIYMPNKSVLKCIHQNYFIYQRIDEHLTLGRDFK